MADPQHPRIPMALDPTTGAILTVPQDSLAEVRQCAAAIMRTPQGSRIENTQIGRKDPRWHNNVLVDALTDALERWEPRAEWQVVADPENNGRVGVRITAVNA